MQEGGFNLSGRSHAAADNAKGKENLIRYILRPPIAQERVRLLPDNQIRIELKRAWTDGTYAIEMDSLSLVSRLAASVPPPRQHSILYSGVLGAAAAWRAEVIPPLAPPAAPEGAAGATAPPAPKPPSAMAFLRGRNDRAFTRALFQSRSLGLLPRLRTCPRENSSSLEVRVRTSPYTRAVAAQSAQQRWGSGPKT